MVADLAMTIPAAVYLLLLRHADSKMIIIIVHGEVPIRKVLRALRREVPVAEIIVTGIVEM